MQVLRYNAKTLVPTLEFPTDIAKTVTVEGKVWTVTEGFHLVTDVADETEAAALVAVEPNDRIIL